MTYTSLHDKKKSSEIQLIPGITFYAVFLALVQMADTDNLSRLERAFPEVVREAKIRYFAPGGALNVGEYLENFLADGEPPPREALERLFHNARVKAGAQ